MIASRKTARLLFSFLPACVMLSACAAGDDSGTYAMPLAEAKAKIAGTKASYQTGSQTRSMRSAGVVAGGLKVKLSNAGTFGSSCVVRFEEVDAENTRITPDCGDTGAATSDAAAKFFELEIAALVRQTLTGEPVDAQKLGKEMVAVISQSLPQMQAEGFAANEEWVERQKEAAIQRAEDKKAGWAD